MGQWQDDDEVVKNIIVGYFSNIYAISKPIDMDNIIGVCQKVCYWWYKANLQYIIEVFYDIKLTIPVWQEYDSPNEVSVHFKWYAWA